MHSPNQMEAKGGKMSHGSRSHTVTWVFRFYVGLNSYEKEQEKR